MYADEEINFDRMASLKDIPEDIVNFFSVGGHAVNEEMVINYCRRTKKAFGDLTLNDVKIFLIGESEGLRDEDIRPLWKELLLINSFPNKETAEFIRALLKINRRVQQ